MINNNSEFLEMENANLNIEIEPLKSKNACLSSTHYNLVFCFLLLLLLFQMETILLIFFLFIKKKE